LLQKQVTPSLGNQRHIPTDMSETEAVSLIVKGHESMMAVMTNRNKNLQVVRALWTSGNMKVRRMSTSHAHMFSSILWCLFHIKQISCTVKNSVTEMAAVGSLDTKHC